MKVFELRFLRNLKEMVDNYTTPELKNEFEILIKENEELFTLLQELLKESQRVIYTKLVGFSEEKKIYTLDKENIVKPVADSFVDLVDELKKYNKTILDSFSPGCGEESYIFLHTIVFIKICIDL